MTVPEQLIAFVKQMDLCWLEHRFEDLEAYLDHRIVVIGAGGTTLSKGREAAIDSYREFMSRCSISSFNQRGFRVVLSEKAATVIYDWSMEWKDCKTSYISNGVEILALSFTDARWRIFLRMQMVI